MNRKILAKVIITIIITVSVFGTLTCIIILTGEENNTEEQPLTIEGLVVSVTFKETFNDSKVYNITLGDGESHLMIFRSEEAVVPPTGVTLRFYYILFNDYYDVYKIKSL